MHLKRSKNSILGGVRKVRIVVMTVAVLCAAAVLIGLFSSSFVCYAVTVNGQTVARADNRENVVNAIEDAERQAAEILGEDVSLSDTVAVIAGVGTVAEEAPLEPETILENIDGIARLWVISVDGITVGAVHDYETVESILDGILMEFGEKDAVSLSFVENIDIDNRCVKETLERDPADIAWMLRPDNFCSVCSLTVSSVIEEFTTETIPYDTEYVYDDTMYSDEVEVLQEGQDGTETYRCLVTVVEGEETDRCFDSTPVVAPPTNKIIAVGTIPGTRTDSTGVYEWPADGTISSYFGYRSISNGSSYHQGIDIANAAGTEVVASDGGKVTYSGWANGYGNFIKIEHDNGDVTCYGHLKEILVDVDERVSQGQIIAYMGNTGISSGPHLHFEVRPGGGEQKDPLDYLADKE